MVGKKNHVPKTLYRHEHCTIARALKDEVGEWWSLLIVRECTQGTTRFDEFRLRARHRAATSWPRGWSELIESGAGIIERFLWRTGPTPTATG